MYMCMYGRGCMYMYMYIHDRYMYMCVQVLCAAELCELSPLIRRHLLS